MRKWIILSVLCGALMSCGAKQGQETVELTPEQEIQMVDSAVNETKAHINELGESVDELQREVDSILNVKK
jgi:peptidoglycan hydrolase CwlO-like protein